jgi:hypothetical protein
MKKLAFAIGLFYSAGALAVNDMYWFKTELSCADARVTVRAYCEETFHAGRVIQRNSLCSRQTLEIERAGQGKIVRNVLERQPRDEVPLTLTSLCCAAAGAKPYLYGSMANGGNCEECEREVVFGLDGQWKRDGKRWLVRGAEKRAIGASMEAWRRIEEVDITNTTRDAAESK